MDYYCDNLYNISESAVLDANCAALRLQPAECLAWHC